MGILEEQAKLAKYTSAGLLAFNGRKHVVPAWFNATKNAETWVYSAGHGISAQVITEPVARVPEIPAEWEEDLTLPSGWRLKEGTGIPEVPEVPLQFRISSSVDFPDPSLFMTALCGFREGSYDDRAGKLIPGGELAASHTNVIDIRFFVYQLPEKDELLAALATKSFHCRVCYKVIES